MNQIWLAFLTGITTGGVSCFAVQGGLLTSALANDEEANITKGLRTRSLIFFVAAKLFAYTLLGALLGFLGSSITPSLKVQGWIQIFIGIYLLGTAGRLLNLHPFFRYFVIQPPKAVLRLLRNQAKVRSALTPLVLGAMTVLIPCGVTQAMMILSITSGSAVLGAGIMLAFTLGTSPVFLLLGMAANQFLQNKAFAVVASLVVFYTGLVSLNSGQTLRGSVHTFQNYKSVILGSVDEAKTANVKGGVQEVTINVSTKGYYADSNTLKAGVPVRLKLVSSGAKGCVRAFTIPSLNISKIIPENGQEILEFTPEKKGTLAYTCNMGMYTGQFTIN